MKLFLIIVFIVATLFSIAQTPINIGEDGIMGGALINFEDTNSQYIWIDTTQNNNIWQIGMPQKYILDSSYSYPNSIITDSLTTYPIQNRSSFYISIINYPGTFDGVTFTFRHKYDFDTLYDGGIIEISFDNGLSWSNIINENVYPGNFYSNTDTINSYYNSPGFTGTSDEWIQSGFDLFWGLQQFPSDTFLIKFSLSSDSIETYQEGWLIDDICICAYCWDRINKKNNDNKFIVFPNPAYDVININQKESSNNEYELIIYDIYGNEVMRRSFRGNNKLNISNLGIGIYIISIQNNNQVYYKKIIKNIR